MFKFGSIYLLCITTLFLVKSEKPEIHTEECSVTKNKSGKLSVTCNFMYLKSVPNFNNAEFISSVDFSNNNISILNRNSFTNFTIVEDINLVRNKIETIDKHTFQTLKFLKNIDLSGNSLRFINPKLFTFCKNLIYLSLAGNPLFSTVGETQLLYSSSLQSLDLSHTQMSHIYAETFSGTPKLRTLVLSRNDIQEIPLKHIVTSLPSLSAIDVSNNPLKCTRSLCIFLKMYSQNEGNIYVRGIECYTRINTKHMLYPWNLTDIYSFFENSALDRSYSNKEKEESPAYMILLSIAAALASVAIIIAIYFIVCLVCNICKNKYEFYKWCTCKNVNIDHEYSRV